MLRIFRRPFQLVCLSVLVLGVGCGPFGYLRKTAKEANRAVADAEAVGAEEYAPYEYWGAVTYLEQSKLMMAYSEYERSFDYGVRAKDLAEEAKKKTQMREAGKDKVTEASTGEAPEAGSEDASAEPATDESGASGASEAEDGQGTESIGGSVEVGGQAQAGAGGNQ